jgi:acyl-CoA synthetase (AMP-forming)/AMP-acid ligase II/acyl carrier protein
MNSQSCQNSADFASWVALMRWRSRQHPNRLAYRFLADGETETDALTYGELDRRARAIAAQLQSLDLAGERALLIHPSGLEFIAAFLGCLYAGVIAVPTYAPRRKGDRSHDRRLQAIARDAEARIVLASEAQCDRLRSNASELHHCPWLASDTVDVALADRWHDDPPTGDTLAFLQYTSGSTGDPKGVAIAHGNILHNEATIQRAFGHGEGETYLSWLPLFHDMGLIGGALQPLYVGGTGILMPPIAFLRDPYCWLHAISRYGAVSSGAPNFAYDLCTRQISPERRASLDLSHWRVAFNGAQPIRTQTLHEFAKAFAPCGFRESAWYPCYGLAETTLLACGSDPERPPEILQLDPVALAEHRVEPKPGGKAIPGCGRFQLDGRLVIVDPATGKRCWGDRVGEIWISGSSVARGYWNRPVESDRVFGSYIADSGAGPFLRTGDLGFVRDGELFVTGRLKDTIIIRARNYYPQDIEFAIEGCHPALRRGQAAAFAIDADGEERVAIAVELERHSWRNPDVEGISRAVTRAVAEEFELPVFAIALLKPATLPKTSSGKVQRRAVREGFLNGTLSEVARLQPSRSTPTGHCSDAIANYIAPRTSVERQLAEIWRELLHVEPIGIHSHFFELGGHSLLATQALSRVEAVFGVELPLRCLFEAPTIAEFARAIEQAIAEQADETDVLQLLEAIERS